MVELGGEGRCFSHSWERGNGCSMMHDKQRMELETEFTYILTDYDDDWKLYCLTKGGSGELFCSGESDLIHLGEGDCSPGADVGQGVQAPLRRQWDPQSEVPYD